MKPSKTEFLDAIKTILSYIDHNLPDDRLSKTPDRVCNFYNTMFNGYHENDSEVISSSCEINEYGSNPIVIEGISFHSICEHHLLPFSGEATITYIPNDKIIGIGKFRKIIEIFSKRLQLQEKLTKEICEAIYVSDLNPLGVNVKLTAKHSCSYVKDYLDTQTLVTTTYSAGSL